MDFKFDNLIAMQIRRLTRPKVKMDFPIFYDEALFENGKVIRDEETMQQLLSICDVSYDGVPASAAISFNPSFGKISQGEEIKVLYTIQNASPTYNLDQLDISCRVESEAKDSEEKRKLGEKDMPSPTVQKLLDKVIAQLGPRETLGFVFTFKIDQLHNY